MSLDGTPTASLHRVVEKRLSSGRRHFEYTPGVWRPSLKEARLDAQRLLPTTLAHRLFICQCGGPGPLGRVVEEVAMPPMRERMLASDEVHRRALAARTHPIAR